MDTLLIFSLEKVGKRLVFDVLEQHERVTSRSNCRWLYHCKTFGGIPVASVSHVELLPGAIFLRGQNDWNKSYHSPSILTFPSTDARNAAYDAFISALSAWASANEGLAFLQQKELRQI